MNHKTISKESIRKSEKELSITKKTTTITTTTTTTTKYLHLDQFCLRIL